MDDPFLQLHQLDLEPFQLLFVFLLGELAGSVIVVRHSSEPTGYSLAGMRRFVPLLAVACLSLLALAAGASGAARLYAPAYGSSGGEPERIHVFDRAGDGSLTPIAGSPFAAYPGPPFSVGGLNGIAFAPEGMRAVGGFLFYGGVQGYSVTGAGVPTPTNSVVTRQSENVALTPDGRFAYIATREYPPASGSEGIRAFALGADGTVTPIGVPYEPSVSFDGEIAITPDSRFLYALDGTFIRRFAIAADGTLTPIGTTMGSGVAYLVADPGGRFLFGGLSGTPGGVVSYAIAADGALTPVGEPALTEAAGLDPFSISPDGTRIYLPSRNSKKIVIVAVAADGAVQVIDSMPAEGVEVTAVSPDNRFVYWFHGGGEYSIRVAAIGPGGGLTPLPFITPYDTSEPLHLLFQPGPAPVADFTAKAAAPGAAASFDAAKSTNAARFDWNFGDGTTLANGGPRPSHSYATAGKYTVTLSLTDDQGCGARQIYTGQSTTCPGGTATTKTLTVDTLPVIGKVKATPKKFLPRGVAGKGEGGTKLRVKLNEAAKIQVKIERRLPGRKVGKMCKKPTAGNASKMKCNRYVKLGSRSKSGKAGWNEIAFGGKLKGKPLAPGGYRVTAVATDSEKGRSAPKSAAFRVLGY